MNNPRKAVAAIRADEKWRRFANASFDALLHPRARVRRLKGTHGHAITYFFPGRWMSDAQLDALRTDIEAITLDRLGALPPYGIYLPGREAFEHRIVTLLYSTSSDVPTAFSAMVNCPVRIANQDFRVMNLGLAMSKRIPYEATDWKSDRLLDLYVMPLLHVAAHFLLRPFWIVAITAKPRAVGALADAFGSIYPDYRGDRPPKSDEVHLARAVLARWGHESGVPADAEFDPSSFVIRGSYVGPTEMLQHDFDSQPKYHRSAANEFCRVRLDYGRGDDFLLLMRVDWRTALRPLLGQLRGLK